MSQALLLLAEVAVAVVAAVAAEPRFRSAGRLLVRATSSGRPDANPRILAVPSACAAQDAEPSE